MKGIQITTPTPNDAEGIQTVIKDTWFDTYPNAEAGITIGDIEDMFLDAFTEKVLQKRKEELAKVPNEERLFLIAKDGVRVVGSCGVTRLHEFNKLSMIYVLPGYQGMGIGLKLWEAVVPFLNKEKNTIVQVATYNKKAIAFYQKLGFTDNGKRFSDEKWRMKSGSIIPEMELILKVNGLQ
jgi:ribosomal protein S18 acetylase RimI-like enzyme